MFQIFCDIGKPFMIVRNLYYTYLKLFGNEYVSYNFIIIINHLKRKYHNILNLLNVTIMLIINILINPKQFYYYYLMI